MNMSVREYELHEACFSDLDTLVDIFARAQASDRVTQIKAQGRPPEYITNLISDPLKSWLLNVERRSVMKAVATTTREVLGWICLGFHNMPARLSYPLSLVPKRPESVAMDPDVRSNGFLPVNTTADADFKTSKTKLENTTPQKKQQDIHDLENLCSEDFQRWMAKLMPDGRACMFIGSICILPEHQGRGIGEALLTCGTRVADDAQVSVWVHSSEVSCRLFTRAGFQEVGRLEIDLQLYQPLHESITSEDFMSKQEIYVYRYMVREPC